MKKTIPITEVVKTAPMTTLARQPDHYLLQSLITLWKDGRVTSAQLSDAYFNVDKATQLLAEDNA